VDEKTTVPALADLQTSMLEGLDEMGARAHASGNSWAVPLLGVTYAATYTLMPTSALDVVPGGKAGKLGKVAKNGDEAAEISSKVAQHSNATPTTALTSSPVSRKTPDDFNGIYKSANHRKAAAGEYNAHALMIEKGFKPLGNTTGEYQPGKNGIDGIYAHPNPPPDYVITEAKYNKAGMCKTADGRQMCDDWVSDKRLEEAGLSKAEREQILDSLKMEDGNVEKYLIRTKPDGSMSTRALNDKGYVSGTPNGF